MNGRLVTGRYFSGHLAQGCSFLGEDEPKLLLQLLLPLQLLLLLLY